MPATKTPESTTGFLCPIDNGATTVINTWERQNDPTISRRRKCLKCGHRFNTIEYIYRAPEPSAATQTTIPRRASTIQSRLWKALLNLNPNEPLPLNSQSEQVQIYHIAKRLGIKVITRKVSAKGILAWRVEPAIV